MRPRAVGDAGGPPGPRERPITLGPETVDVLGDGYTARTIELAPDSEGPVVATLVRRRAKQDGRIAVLYVHGYVDYFFQTEMAGFYADRGVDFYALDLRKYGRSLLSHQTPYQMTDVADYFEELDAARDVITCDGHDDLIVAAHSTGGLITALWLAVRPRATARALVLNSPFLEINASWPTRSLLGPPLSAIGTVRPRTALPLPSGEYGRSLHRDHRGEWEFDTRWKPLDGVPLRLGWLSAVRRAQAKVHAGLDLRIPILVMCSTRSITTTRWSPELLRADAVLDADSIARWSVALGRHVTCVRIADGMHDLILSRPDVRAEVYATTGRWLDAYGAV